MHPLNNPSWNALTTLQAPWAQVRSQSRRFPAEVCVHGAFEQATPEAWQSLAPMAHDPVNIFSLEPLDLPPGWTVTRKLEMYQMVHEDREALSTKQNRKSEILELAAPDLAEMTELYAATRPGRVLCPRMHELGGFIGIRHEGLLVAMACLRLHFPGYREISTVGTRPGHTGHGHATAVVAELARRIHAAQEEPFLTVQTNNARAIAIYRRLGFRERAFMHSTTVRVA
ncbi:MAG TPA: GNAT family N-acetyltransferase [Candidatus Angelobacter sp.]